MAASWYLAAMLVLGATSDLPATLRPDDFNENPYQGAAKGMGSDEYERRRREHNALARLVEESQAALKEDAAADPETDTFTRLRLESEARRHRAMVRQHQRNSLQMVAARRRRNTVRQPAPARRPSVPAARPREGRSTRRTRSASRAGPSLLDDPSPSRSCELTRFVCCWAACSAVVEIGLAAWWVVAR